MPEIGEFSSLSAKEIADRAFQQQQAAQGEALREGAAEPEPNPTGPKVSAVGQGLAWPPGRAGRIASYLHQLSYLPVAEISIVATLGLLAGVCGRAYRTYTGADLALYIILVAKSGIGKDHMHEAVPHMLNLSDRPMAPFFCRAQDFASGEALHKEVLREPGFLYLQGEFGRRLKRMANPGDAPMQTFRTTMLNAFGKRFLEGKSYSNSENSLLGVEWPALSFLGETTPGTFLECITPDMMADGFLSRFLVVSYLGDCPLPNRQRAAQLAREDLAAWQGLVDHALPFQMVINTPDALAVAPSAEARAALEAFEIECIQAKNATEDETERQVWTRAHIKALKVASLLAVADNYLNPIISPEQAEWALGLVRMDVEVFQQRKRSGDVGTGDDARQLKLLAFVSEYFTKRPTEGYGVTEKMWKESIVPRRFLQMRCSSLPAFSNHKQGAARAMDDAIRSMVQNAYLIEVKRDRLVELYGFHGVAYRIIDLPNVTVKASA